MASSNSASSSRRWVIRATWHKKRDTGRQNFVSCYAEQVERVGFSSIGRWTHRLMRAVHKANRFSRPTVVCDTWLKLITILLKWTSVIRFEYTFDQLLFGNRHFKVPHMYFLDKFNLSCKHREIRKKTSILPLQNLLTEASDFKLQTCPETPPAGKRCRTQDGMWNGNLPSNLLQRQQQQQQQKTSRA